MIGELSLPKDSEVSKTRTLMFTCGAYLRLIQTKAEAVWKSGKSKDIQVGQICVRIQVLPISSCVTVIG